MPVRQLVLAITAAAVLALAVYLFVEVHAKAADAMTPAPPPTQAAGQSAPAPEAARGAPGKAAPRPTAALPTPPTAAPPEPSAPANDDQPFDVDEALRTNVKIELVMDQANKAYDRQDYYQAKQIATRVLAQQGSSVRMMRIMVSASCMDGDIAVAQKYYAQLPGNDREQMKRRCDANGVTLQDPAP